MTTAIIDVWSQLGEQLVANVVRQSGVKAERIERIFACAEEATCPFQLNTKRRGEVAELQFAVKAINLGFGVAKPIGDSEQYDFIVAGRKFWRVQVRSLGKIHRHSYQAPLTHGAGSRPYERDAFDFLAVYVGPEDTWYVIPFAELGGRRSACLYPHVENSRGKYEKYREAWDGMR